jgi:hypothetical protein
LFAHKSLIEWDCNIKYSCISSGLFLVQHFRSNFFFFFFGKSDVQQNFANSLCSWCTLFLHLPWSSQDWQKLWLSTNWLHGIIIFKIMTITYFILFHHAIWEFFQKKIEQHVIKWPLWIFFHIQLQQIKYWCKKMDLLHIFWYRGGDGMRLGLGGTCQSMFCFASHLEHCWGL